MQQEVKAGMDELDPGDDLLSSNASDEPLQEFDELVEAADALLTRNGRRPSSIAHSAATIGGFVHHGIDTIEEEPANRTNSCNNPSPIAAFEHADLTGKAGYAGQQMPSNTNAYAFTSRAAGIYSTQAPTVQVGKLRITEAQAKLYGIYDYETHTIKIPKTEARTKASRSKVEELSKPKTVQKSTSEKPTAAAKATTKRRHDEYSEKIQNRPCVADTAVSFH